MTEPRSLAPPPFPERPPQEPRPPLPVVQAVLLALLLGPLGVAFTSVPAAIFTGFVALVFGLFTYGTALVAVWIFCAILTFIIAPRPPQDAAEPSDSAD
jgi:hypothetical protein